MSLKPIGLRVVPRTASTARASTPATRPAASGAPRPASALSVPRPVHASLDAYKGALIKAVAVAQQSRSALEETGRAYNAGTADRPAFERAEAAFVEAIAELSALRQEGRRFNTPFWHFGGFKLKKFFQQCGAQELLAYRPPTLGQPVPAPVDTFGIKLGALKRAASDGVDPEAGLLKLLAVADTPDQVEQILKAGRRGRAISPGSDYWVECSSAFFTAAHARREQLEAPATLEAKLASLRRLAEDAVPIDARLSALLPEATTPAQLEQILKAGRRGRTIAVGSNYYLECGEAFFAAAHARREAIEQPKTFAERLDSLKKTASDGVSPEPGLLALAAEAKTDKELDSLLAAGRKGHRLGIGSNYWVECSEAFFARVHTRKLQLELASSVPTTDAAARVKFALQPLPHFADFEAYRNHSVRAAAYALIEVDELRAARAAFAEGKLPERQLREVEDRLELSLKLVAALRKADPSAEAAAFWQRYDIESTAKQALEAA